jgi:hypothetical protein
MYLFLLNLKNRRNEVKKIKNRFKIILHKIVHTNFLKTNLGPYWFLGAKQQKDNNDKIFFPYALSDSYDF